MEELISFGIFLVLMTIGYFSGKSAEKRHYQSILAREREFVNLPAVTLKRADDERPVAEAKLVSGSVVISVDYFKRFVAGLRNFFGGRMGAYESLVDRARREAILRMKEQSKRADIILNMRLETSTMNDGAKNTVSSIEVIAYGTAVKYAAGEPQAKKSLSAAAARPAPADVSAAAPSRYKVVFSGEIAPGQELDAVKANVAALYKTPVEKCAHLFSGRPVTIKGDLDAPTAQKYKTAFEKTGAVCRIVPM